MKLILFFYVLLLSYSVTGIAPLETCERNWIKVGCFHDRVTPDRPLPEQLVNHRDKTDPAYDGHMLDWKDWPKSLHALACRCAELTRAKGYRYFGIQAYGECWSGPSHQYDRDGPSKSCVGIDHGECNDKATTECAGKATTNYIYDLEPVCTKRVEMGIIIDASSSVLPEIYQKIKKLIARIGDEFSDGNGCIRFGMIHFSWDAHLDFTTKQNEYWNKTALMEKIKSSSYLYGGTRIDRALYKAEKELFCNRCVRSKVKKVLMVFTDGKSSMESDSMMIATERLKLMNIQLIAIGIGHNINNDELIAITSKKDHVLVPKDFYDLKDRLTSLLKMVK